MDVVIIGNSKAAIEAVKSFRHYDKDSRLTVISKEKHYAYSRPLIAEYLYKEKSYEEIMYVSSDFYNENNVELLKGVEVVELSTDRRELLTNQNHKITFDRLLIATGSKPLIPPISGINLTGVHTFWTIEDAQSIARRMTSVKQAVVIGAGLVGMSAIYALYNLGIRVSVVEMLDRVLMACLDNSGSEVIQDRMIQSGIDLYLNRKVTEIREGSTTGEVASVRLDDETIIPCQIVVAATGIRPNVDFLRDSALKIDQGIIVNEYLESSLPNIYAAGDVAQPYDIIQDKNSVMANLPNASEQGRIVGANLAGQQIPYQGGLSMTAMRYFGIPFVSIGELSKPTPQHEEISVFNRDMSIYRKLIMLDTRPIGAVLVGDIDQAGIITHLIRNKINLPSPQDLLERSIKFEKFRKNMMKDDMEGEIQWKETIGREEPWRKDRAKIPGSKEESS